jgi:hypothetical protein
MAKRANGEGTKIVKVPDRDLYKARYTDAGGKRRTVYGKTKGEVRKKLTEGLADRDKVDLRRRHGELTGAFRPLVRDFR